MVIGRLHAGILGLLGQVDRWRGRHPRIWTWTVGLLGPLLVLGVWADWQVSARLVDAIIGLSVVYKAFENMGGFERVFGISPDTRIAVLVFGLFHGLGLATKLQGYIGSGDGLFTNLLSFNLGVELGQVLALSLILVMLLAWRRRPAFERQAFGANAVLMCAGFVLAGNQFAGYLFA